MADKIITPEIAASLREAFKDLKNDVSLHAFVQPGVNEEFNKVLVELVNEIAAISPKIKAKIHGIGDEDSRRYGVQRSPTLLISPEKYKIRYTGAPAGEEGRSFIGAILMASGGKGFLEQGLAKRVASLNSKRDVKVFVSPT
jgi:thioredoxin reductase (NADPH)